MNTICLSDELERSCELQSHFLGLESVVRTYGFENHPLLNPCSRDECLRRFGREVKCGRSKLVQLLRAPVRGPDACDRRLPGDAIGDTTLRTKRL